MALEAGWAALSGVSNRQTAMPELDGAEAVYQVAGRLTFAGFEHDTRDEALALLSARLIDLYGPGDFKVQVADSLLRGSFLFIPASPIPVSAFPADEIDLNP